MQSSKKPSSGKGVLKIIPLGGLGEVGKNMTVYEYEDDIIIIDIGFNFPDGDMLGIDYLIPDISYLQDKKDKIRGVLITHGHEDHVGGIPYIMNQINAPIYAPKLTCGLIEAKASEHPHLRHLKLNVIDPDKDKIKLGAFEVEWFRVTHSIPDAVGIVLNTPVGRVVYTGDFRFDHSPVDGKKTDISKLSKLGDEGVLALLSDSTNSEIPGFSISEKTIADTFDSIFEKAKGRIIVASFASQINRIQLVINAANKHHRKIAFSGRSLLRNIEVAVRLGYLKIPQGLAIKVQDIGNYPANKVVVMSTGSQGEAMAALSRMARGEHKQIKIGKGDTVVYSSSPIPGNESAITAVVDDLFRRGAEVIFDEKNGSRTHVTGHPGQEELKLMMELLRPKYLVPWHGEIHHLIHHAQLAQSIGIPEENTPILDIGDVLEITKDKAIKSDKKVQNGVVLVDGLGIGDVGEIVLRDRKVMATEGMFIVICTVDKKTGRLLTSPDIISRGFIYMRENEQLVNNARGEVKKMMIRRDGEPLPDWTKMKLKIRDHVSQYLYSHTKRSPMVISVIIEV
ncbi:ribonuclease J [candidate division WS5 bacterium]|uniref:Ribonuclease J n=1 Tax=candidate division WS5 bacterium TaxID=2093353 RepID=A0A419DET6_9BACT|nr:MAG: ribonuclease J [candidate division WS5 bacterium]